MSTILVTAIGSFSAEATIDRLKELGHRVVGCDIYPREWVANSLFVDSFYQAPFANDSEAYVAFLLDLLDREQINYVLPLTDIEIDAICSQEEKAKEIFERALISNRTTLAICRNKKATHDFIRKSNSGVKAIDNIDNWRTSAPGFPFIAKPHNGRSSEGLKIIRTNSEWEDLCESEDADSYVVQPYIKGSVITVDAVRDTFGNVVCIPRKELLRTHNGAGTSVQVFHEDNLVHGCQILANELEVLGCVNFEFINTLDGKYYFLECNPRFSGGIKFSCMAAYDCIGNHLLAHEDKRIEPLGPYEDCYIARRFEEYTTKREH